MNDLEMKIMKLIKTRPSAILFGLLAILVFFSCTPEDEDLSLGKKAEASFTITDISTPDMKNTYLLESTSEEGAFAYKWDLGNGEVFAGNQIDTAYFENSGTYDITLTVSSAGGYTVATQSVTVENDAITGEDLVVGGDMEDESAWSFTTSGNTPIDHAFENGELVVTDGNPAQATLAMWQKLELKGGRAYQFDASIRGAGMTNSWMEVILIEEEPAEGSDPSGDVFVGLNTWTGCGNDAFDTNLLEISCLGDGRINVATDGTYYLVIKIGSWDGYLGDGGLIVDDIEFIAQPRLTEGDNILTGSDMETPGAWTITNMGLALTDVEFTNGVMKFSNGTASAQTNVGVWQSVEVEAGQIYKLKATVNDSGSTGSWIEFYFSDVEPVDGVDYTSGRIEPEDTKSFESPGTVYVLVKVGSWNGNLGAEGVAIDDVELVEMN